MQNSPYKKTLFWTFLYGIAFGYLEAAVVIYLRQIFYPEGFYFPVKIISGKLITVELIREFATLLMILSICVLSGKSKIEKFAYFMYVFGIWDIFYYVFLKLFLNWPSSLLDYDLLFLLPVAWVGPVLAPVIISLLIIIAAIFIIYFENNEYTFYHTKQLWFLEISGGFVVFISFILSAKDVAEQKFPQHFYWWLFLVGVLIGILPFIYAIIKTVKKNEKKL
jgi:hypothetical protein